MNRGALSTTPHPSGGPMGSPRCCCKAPLPTGAISPCRQSQRAAEPSRTIGSMYQRGSLLQLDKGRVAVTRSRVAGVTTDLLLMVHGVAVAVAIEPRKSGTPCTRWSAGHGHGREAGIRSAVFPARLLATVALHIPAQPHRRARAWLASSAQRRGGGRQALCWRDVARVVVVVATLCVVVDQI